jgi:hypothetical protein
VRTDERELELPTWKQLWSEDSLDSRAALAAVVSYNRIGWRMGILGGDVGITLASSAVASNRRALWKPRSAAFRRCSGICSTPIRIALLVLIAAVGGCSESGIGINPQDVDMGATDDLSDADLSGADLSSPDLSSSDLSGFDLSISDLSRPDLVGQPPADLAGVHQDGALPPTFADGMPYSAGTGAPHWMGVGDITGDGKLDVAVTTLDNTNNLLVLIGDGKGAFASPVTTTLKSPTALAVADFNDDTKADVVVSDVSSTASSTSQVDLLVSNGDGTFGTPTPYLICLDSGDYCPSVGGDAQALAVTDLNHDLRPDVAVAQSGVVTSPMFGSIAKLSVLLDTATGDFQTKGPYRPSTDFPTGGDVIAAGDFNNDMKMDLAYAQTNSKIIIMLGNGDGTFQALSPITASAAEPGALATGDFNNDGKIDLLALDTFVNLSLGNGDGTFKPYVKKPAGGGAGQGLAVADFNRDGNLDIVAPNYNAGTATVLVGHGDGTFQNITLKVGTAPVSKPLNVAVGDLNGDGKPDIIVNDMSVLTVFINATP